MVALLSQHQTTGFQHILITAGLQLVTYNNNLYIGVELSRLGKSKLTFAVSELRPHVPTTYVESFTLPFLLQKVKQGCWKHQFLVIGLT